MLELNFALFNVFFLEESFPYLPLFFFPWPIPMLSSWDVPWHMAYAPASLSHTWIHWVAMPDNWQQAARPPWISSLKNNKPVLHLWHTEMCFCEVGWVSCDWSVWQRFRWASTWDKTDGKWKKSRERQFGSENKKAYWLTSFKKSVSCRDIKNNSQSVQLVSSYELWHQEQYISVAHLKAWRTYSRRYSSAEIFNSLVIS